MKLSDFCKLLCAGAVTLLPAACSDDNVASSLPVDGGAIGEANDVFSAAEWYPGGELGTTTNEQGCYENESPWITQNGMTQYTVLADLSAADSNTVKLSLSAEGKTLSYEEYLGGRVQKNEAADADPNTDLAMAESGVSAVFEKLSAADSGIAGWTSESVLKAELSKKLNFTQQQAFTLRGSLIAGIGENTASLKLEMAASQGRTVSVVLVGTKGETSLASVTFQENVQTVEVSLSGVNWAKIGEVECLRFHVASGEDALSVFVGNIVVYGK